MSKSYLNSSFHIGLSSDLLKDQGHKRNENDSNSQAFMENGKSYYSYYYRENFHKYSASYNRGNTKKGYH